MLLHGASAVPHDSRGAGGTLGADFVVSCVSSLGEPFDVAVSLSDLNGERILGAAVPETFSCASAPQKVSVSGLSGGKVYELSIAAAGIPGCASMKKSKFFSLSEGGGVQQAVVPDSGLASAAVAVLAALILVGRKRK